MAFPFRFKSLLVTPTKFFIWPFHMTAKTLPVAPKTTQWKSGGRLKMVSSAWHSLWTCWSTIGWTPGQFTTTKMMTNCWLEESWTPSEEKYASAIIHFSFDKSTEMNFPVRWRSFNEVKPTNCCVGRWMTHLMSWEPGSGISFNNYYYILTN